MGAAGHRSQIPPKLMAQQRKNMMISTLIHSWFMILLYFHDCWHCRLSMKASKLFMNLWENAVNKVWNDQKHVFCFFQISHPLLWLQLCTLLAFSRWASSGTSSGHPFAFTLQSTSSQSVWIGFRSGDCESQVVWHSTPSNPFSVKSPLHSLEVCLWSLSCWEINDGPTQGKLDGLACCCTIL